MIPQPIRDEIARRLAALEAEEEARILYAVESGSRAWGFPSQDSDYDVRFIFVRRPEWYLSVDLETRRDVIERPIVDEIDLSGWDIRKALRLFAKSNPPLLEWLASPIVYRDDGIFAPNVRALLPEFYSPSSSIHHYLHMARGNFAEFLRGRELVKLKKYLYVLRPLLGVRWLEQDRGPVPMLFRDLYVTIADSPDLLADIGALVARKMAGEELGEGPAIPSISEFAAAELDRLAGFKPPRPVVPGDLESLSTLFRATLRQVQRSTSEQWASNVG